MSAIDTVFSELRRTGRKALMPFVTAGDPDLDFTREVLLRLAARGAALCELGVPYSDPVADGPVIQASYTRALERKIKLDEIFAMLSGVAPQLPVPVATMVSYAIVYRRGLEQYVLAAKAAGAAGTIVPDLPVEEAGRLAEICRREDFSLIQLIAPTTPRPRALRIAEQTTGFIYYVSVHGDHRRAERIAAGPGRERQLAAAANAAADLHRLRREPAGARAAARPRGRRTDRRFGDRSPPGGGRDAGRARRSSTRSTITSASCSRRWRREAVGAAISAPP